MRDHGENEGLIALIDEVEKIEGINAARILYLYPTTTNAKLIQKIIDSKVFVNYFDMPIQHINDEMLKIMRRGANKDKIIELLTSSGARTCPTSEILRASGYEFTISL